MGWTRSFDTASQCAKIGALTNQSKPQRGRSEPMSQNITRVGIDLAKNIFQVCAVDQHGKVVFNKTIKRPKLKEFIANLPGELGSGL